MLPVQSTPWCVCRFTHDAALWACLAALSMAAGELATAEAAFAAIDAVDKLQFVLHLKGLQAGGAGAAAGATAGGGGGGGRDPLVASELALYAGQINEAEAALLQVCLNVCVWGGGGGVVLCGLAFLLSVVLADRAPCVRCCNGVCETAGCSGVRCLRKGLTLHA